MTRNGHRLATCVAMTAVALTVWTPLPTDAADSGVGGVRIAFDGAAGPFLSPALLRRTTDVGQQRTWITRDGMTDRGVDLAGVSARALTQLAGVPPEALAGMTVVRTNGGTIELTAAEVADGFPASYPDGDTPLQAVFYAYNVESGEVEFARPMRDREDDNGDDQVQPSRGQTLNVRLHLRDGLTVHPVTFTQAPPRSVAAGTTVAFGARIDAPDGDAATYRWSFDDDGARPDGAETSHVFATAGSWNVTVTATTPGGAVGFAQAVVEVPGPRQPEPETPAGERTPAGGLGDSPTPSPGDGRGAPTGPAAGTPGPGQPRGGRRGGRPGGGADRTDRGGTRGGSVRTPATPDGRARRPSPSPEEPASPSPPAQPQTPPAAAPPAASDPASSDGSGDDGRDAGAGSAPSAPAAGARRSRPQPRRGGGRAGLEQVSGLLLASAGTDLAALPGADARAQPGNPTRAGGSGSARPRWWVLGIAAVVGLIGLGALREAGLRKVSLR